jgi:hypothetical protein
MWMLWADAGIVVDFEIREVWLLLVGAMSRASDRTQGRTPGRRIWKKFTTKLTIENGVCFSSFKNNIH